MFMVCGKCGFNNGNVNYCQNCGNPLVPVNNNQVINNSNVQPVNNQVVQPNPGMQPNNQTMNYNQGGQQVPVTNQQMSYQQPQQPIYQQYNNQQSVYQQGVIPNPPKKKTGLIILVVFLVLFVLIGVGVFLGITLLNIKPIVEEEKVITTTLDIDNGKRTILVYMIGSNLESESGEATDDLDEMIKSGFDEDAVNILVYTGGSKKWHNTIISNEENAIYKLTSNGLEKVNSYSQKSMTSASTLTEFIDYVYDNYKTELYDLILWDHGGGPIYGYGSDEFFPSTALSISDINRALDDSRLLKETKFEWIGFDACLMSSIEIANVLKEEANYFIASEETVPAYGWDYNFLKGISKSTTTKELGSSIVKYYGDFYEKFNSSAKIYALYGYNLYQNYSLAFIDLSKVDSVVKEVEEGFANLSNGVTSTTFNLLAINTTRTTVYGCYSDDVCYNLVDLYNLATGISGQISNGNRIQQAVSDAVIAQRSNISGSYGLSIYFPVKNKEYASQFATYYEKLNFSSNYVNFLKSYAAVSAGDSFVKTNTKDMMPSISNNSLSVTLDDNLANNYLKGDFSIFVKNKHGGYFPVYRGYDVKLDGKVLSTKPVKKELVITNGKGKEESFATSFEYKRDSKSVTYLVLASLDNGDISNFKMESVFFYVKFDNGSNEGKIIDIKPCKSDGTLGKATYNLNDWVHVSSFSSSYQLDDKDGNALQEWETSSAIYGYEYNIKKDGVKFYLRDFDKKQEYYYVFRMEDTQGNKHVFKKIRAQ